MYLYSSPAPVSGHFGRQCVHTRRAIFSISSVLVFASVVAATLLVACGKTADEGGSPHPVGTQIGNYHVVAVTNGGALAGRVTVQGDAAAAALAIGMRHVSNGQTECCDGSTDKPQQKLLVNNGGLKNVVVSIVRCDSGIAPSFGRTELDQKFCDFSPHVVAVMVGDSLALVNSDPIVHTVHGYRGIRTAFNIATSRQGGHWYAQCPDTGVTRCICDAGHGWMESFIHVLSNPYFAVTDGDGAFTIEHIPPGRYLVRYAHESWNDVERTITVPASGTAQSDLVLDVKDATK